MRTLELKQRSKFKDVDVLTQILSAPSKEGAQIEFMRFAFKVLDKIEASSPRASGESSDLVLEDKEYERLNSLVQSFPFAFPHRDFLALAEDMAGAPETKLLRVIPGGRDKE